MPKVIAGLNAAFAKGQLSWVDTPYWRSGMFGRVQIQITHAENYAKLSAIIGVDLVAETVKALIPEMAYIRRLASEHILTSGAFFLPLRPHGLRRAVRIRWEKLRLRDSGNGCHVL